MNKIISIITILILVVSCREKKENSIAFASDNPAERIVWERVRLADPNTGQIPKHIRKKK